MEAVVGSRKEAIVVVTAKGRLSLTAGSEVGVGIVEANGLSKSGRRTAVLGESGVRVLLLLLFVVEGSRGNGEGKVGGNRR